MKSDHRLTDLLAAAGLARSTYFYHQARLDEPDHHAALKQSIRDIFTRSKQRYGYRRIWRELRHTGSLVNKKLVYKLMQELGLKSKVRRRRRYNSYRGQTSHIADNKLSREFVATKPNRKWVSDVTEFRVAGQKLYLSPLMDLCDHRIISFTLSTSPSTAFTAASLKATLEQEKPKKGLMVHTDQGFQYQHSSWRNLIKEHHGVQSMSRKGNCYDNAVMENFFGHLKAEMFHGEMFHSVDELTAEIEEYIDWYNTDRCQERLNGMTPMQYRNHAA